ncbi:MAG: response regulator transcription factor [Magnetococcus sp. YQC-3]
MNNIKIFLIDDHDIVLHGLKKIFNKESDIVVVGEALCGRDAINKIRSTDVDVVIQDVSLPDMDGLELLNQILRLKPELPVLIYTMFDENPLAIPYLKAGAKGFLTKRDSSDLLVAGIRQVHSGKKFITSKVSEILLDGWMNESNEPSHTSLSNREFTVFCMISSGKTITQISDELAIAKATVSIYRKRILDKMGLKTNAALMRYAIENKIIVPEG